IGDARALPPVLDALKGKGIRQDGTPTPGCIVSEEAFIKEAAVTALGHFRDPRVIPDLIVLLKDVHLRDRAAASLALIGDAAIEPLVSFLHDPKASEVESEGERVLSFASARLTAVDALRKIVIETLRKLGWELPPDEQTDAASQPEYTSVDKPLGEGRFGPSGDFAKGA
ncbi:MAG: HEAT repeat domain-containing protein, partial [Nitrospiraceae bacterium]